MKIRNIISVIIFCAVIEPISAQQINPTIQYCDDIVSTTNPQSPVDLRGQPFLNQDPNTLEPKFDWLLLDTYRWFKQNKPQPFYEINSPFRPSSYNDENISHLMNSDLTLRDNLIEDGWELKPLTFKGIRVK